MVPPEKLPNNIKLLPHQRFLSKRNKLSDIKLIIIKRTSLLGLFQGIRIILSYFDFTYKLGKKRELNLKGLYNTCYLTNILTKKNKKNNNTPSFGTWVILYFYSLLSLLSLLVSFFLIFYLYLCFFVSFFVSFLFFC